MMITLDDVVRLVGLQIDGEPVVADWQPYYGDILASCYRLRPPHSGRYHTCINIGWLTQRFEDLLLADACLPAIADQ